MKKYYVTLFFGLLILITCISKPLDESNESSSEVPDSNQVVSDKYIDLDSALLTHSDSVSKLYLGGSGLKSIPKVVFTFKNLKALDISRNSKIDTIPAEISNLKNLEELNVAYCGIKYFSSGLADLKNLKRLNLLLNQLSTLPDDFCELESLVELNLNGNYLDSLPECICDLKNLRYLSANYDEGTTHLDSSEYFRIKACLPNCSFRIRKIE